MKKRKTTPKKTWKQLSLFRIASTLIVLLVLLIIFSSYSSIKLPFESGAFADKVDVSIGYIPFVPKTNQQIIKAALVKNSHLTAASEKLVLTIGTAQDGKNILSLETEGYFNLQDADRTYQLKIKGFSENSPFLAAESFEKGSNLYFRTDAWPRSWGFDLSRIYGKTYRINVDDMSTKLSISPKSDSSIKEDTKKFINENIKNKVGLKKAQRRVESVDGKKSWIFRFNLSQEQVSSLIMRKVQTKEAALDLIVDQSSGNLVGSKITGTIASGNLDGLFVGSPTTMSLGELKVSLSFQLTEVGQRKEIQTPAKATSLDSIEPLVDEIFGKEYLQNPNDFLELVRRNSDFAANFLTLERLGHVFLLVPTAF